MSVHRFLTKRDRHHRDHLGKHHEAGKSSPDVPARPTDPSSPEDFYGLFDGGKDKGPDTHEEQKVKALRKRVLDSKSIMMKDAHIIWALRSNFAHGDPNKAFDLLLAMSNASEGLVMEYDPSVKLLGAENRQGVTCFLDSTLFAMFSRLDSFEAMLYNTFNDIPRNRLGLLLRLWVNLLRCGKLITTDITKLIQGELAECGWDEAAKLCQQDASEAFSFITGKLELPLLTLKMDIYHTGKEDEADDHRFINERLLEVAVPADSPSENQAITLEDCLEEYFNNRIEVRRYLERTATMSPLRAHDWINKGSGAVHVESVELDSDSSPATPLSSSPSQFTSSRPSYRHRAPSIIRERYIPDRSGSGFSTLMNVDSKGPVGRTRTGSIRKEVMMPAWQFFSLIPWYTDHAPSDDAQVAAHFSSKRPVLGLCLKRYSMTANGKAMRLGTQIDIPLEIGLPHFIQDDHMQNDGPIFGNFKLSLQSVVCHRGVSVDSGHYIALTRGTTVRRGSFSSSIEDSQTWMRFDDLAQQRITLIDIDEALKKETPYLLFYQIVPIEGDPGHIMDDQKPPSYSASETNDSGIGASMTSLALHPSRGEQPTSDRPNFDLSSIDDLRDQSPILEPRRPSIAFSEPVPTSGQNAVLSVEGPLSRTSSRSASPSRRKSASESRPHSRGGDGLSKTLSRLTGIRSKEAHPAEVAGVSDVQAHENLTSVAIMGEARATIAPPKHVPQKSHKREKSKSRLNKAGLGRSKGNKPDRECIVM